MGIEEDQYSADTGADGKVQYLIGMRIQCLQLSSPTEFENVVSTG
jgi:hypothetical protein